ncbi:hypothetical protein MN116_000139 [Schistosoma mekongi]|uniref:Integrase catalytic domain-containing protein n=1 Tax=Schistosoma mekongi TaxID=38744 RepID=A0AAE1Z8W6_SCHME|nr:hypothetical protein MN116_000139 [Schistosoma mekongi]
MLAYDFKIRYKSTTTFGHADILSRLIATQKFENEDVIIATVSLEDDIHHILQTSIQATPLSAVDIKSITKTDDELQNIIRYLLCGWPPHLNATERQYFHRRDALSVVDDCLMFGDRIVIPQSLRHKVLSQLHSAHPGIVRMKSLARSYVYWPDIDTDVMNYVLRCPKCSQAAKAPRKTGLCCWEPATHPWSRVHIDFAGPLDGKHYLVIVDAFSKWPEVHLMGSTSTKATLNKLRQIFSCFGIPEVLVSDNGPQFLSSEFQKFCVLNSIKHIRTPPYHPRSNGQVERFVDTFKRALIKAQGEGGLEEILYKFLFTYRSTPNLETVGKISPAEAMFGRKIRMSLDSLKPNSATTIKRNTKMEAQYNKKHGAKPRRFYPGQKVWVRDFHHKTMEWVPGIILRDRGQVIYEVGVSNMRWIRHANHIRSSRYDGGDEANLRTPMMLNTLLDLDNSGSQKTKTMETRTAPLLRKSQRIRRKPNRIKVNPYVKSYQ